MIKMLLRRLAAQWTTAAVMPVAALQGVPDAAAERVPEHVPERMAGRRYLEPPEAAAAFAEWMRVHDFTRWLASDEIALYYEMHCNDRAWRDGPGLLEPVPPGLLTEHLAKLPGVVRDRRRIRCGRHGDLRQATGRDRITVYRVASVEEYAAMLAAATVPSKPAAAANPSRPPAHQPKPTPQHRPAPPRRGTAMARAA